MQLSQLALPIVEKIRKGFSTILPRSAAAPRLRLFRYLLRSRRLSTARFSATAICLFALVGWWYQSDLGFWLNVWTQQTFFPQDASNDANSRPDVSPVQFTQRPRRPAFDFSTITVPANEIHAGGPPKDGIPALTNPRFTSARDATYLRPQDRVIGVFSANRAKAYPLKILNYHEIINDRLGDLPVAVTYCPLCDSCAVFDRRTELGERIFGVSGLLYNSNVLMYDRGGRPESLWSQVMAKGISGPGARKPLAALPLELTTWGAWQSRYPNTMVLSAETGYRRDYSRSPYGSYFSSPQLMFPAKPSSNRLPAKSRVLGVWTGSVARAYPEAFFGQGRRRVEDVLDGKRIVIEFNSTARSLRVVEADQGLHWIYSLWFAWYAFHPATGVVGQ